jgi:hypothetical protein
MREVRAAAQRPCAGATMTRDRIKIPAREIGEDR